MYTAHTYPAPDDAWTETVEIWNTQADILIINDGEVRDHPEVPLSDARLDEVLDRLGYRRTGPWQRDEDDQAEAPVEPVEWLLRSRAAYASQTIHVRSSMRARRAASPARRSGRGCSQ